MNKENLEYFKKGLLISGILANFKREEGIPCFTMAEDNRILVVDYPIKYPYHEYDDKGNIINPNPDPLYIKIFEGENMVDDLLEWLKINNKKWRWEELVGNCKECGKEVYKTKSTIDTPRCECGLLFGYTTPILKNNI